MDGKETREGNSKKDEHAVRKGMEEEKVRK
jgi:hypothetical protein